MKKKWSSEYIFTSSVSPINLSSFPLNSHLVWNARIKAAKLTIAAISRQRMMDGKEVRKEGQKKCFLHLGSASISYILFLQNSSFIESHKEREDQQTTKYILSNELWWEISCASNLKIFRFIALIKGLTNFQKRLLVKKYDNGQPKLVFICVIFTSTNRGVQRF